MVMYTFIVCNFELLLLLDFLLDAVTNVDIF